MAILDSNKNNDDVIVILGRVLADVVAEHEVLTKEYALLESGDRKTVVEARCEELIKCMTTFEDAIGYFSARSLPAIAVQAGVVSRNEQDNYLKPHIKSVMQGLEAICQTSNTASDSFLIK